MLLLLAVAVMAALALLGFGLYQSGRVVGIFSRVDRDYVRALALRNAELEGHLSVSTDGLLFRAIPTQAKYLQPGDLWSHDGPEYWEQDVSLDDGVGQLVAVRTLIPVPEGQEEHAVYRIEIVEQK